MVWSRYDYVNPSDKTLFQNHCDFNASSVVFYMQTYSIPSSPPPNSSHQRSLSASDSQDESEEKLSKTNLYIRGLPPATTDEDLNNLCSRLVRDLPFTSNVCVLHNVIPANTGRNYYCWGAGLTPVLKNCNLMPALLTGDLNTKVQRCKFLSLMLLDFCDCLFEHWSAQLHIL